MKLKVSDPSNMNVSFKSPEHIFVVDPIDVAIKVEYTAHNEILSAIEQRIQICIKERPDGVSEEEWRTKVAEVIELKMFPVHTEIKEP